MLLPEGEKEISDEKYNKNLFVWSLASGYK